MDVSETGVVIPAYNAELTIKAVIEALCVIGFTKNLIIVVDDGSCDHTADILHTCGVLRICHTHNMGKGAALKTGFQYAQSQALSGVITIDADGQHRVQDISRILEHRDAYDVIIGSRYEMQAMPWLRRLVNRITSLVISLLAQTYIPDVQCGLRYIGRPVLECINLSTSHYQTESELVYKAVRHRFRIGFVPVKTVYETETSYIRPVIDTVRFVAMAVGFLWR